MRLPTSARFRNTSRASLVLVSAAGRPNGVTSRSRALVRHGAEALAEVLGVSAGDVRVRDRAAWANH
jgi:hypothetical protein